MRVKGAKSLHRVCVVPKTRTKYDSRLPLLPPPLLQLLLHRDYRLTSRLHLPRRNINTVLVLSSLSLSLALALSLAPVDKRISLVHAKGISRSCMCVCQRRFTRHLSFGCRRCCVACRARLFSEI